MSNLDSIVLSILEDHSNNSNEQLSNLKKQITEVYSKQGFQTELFQATQNFLPPNDQTLLGHLLLFIFDTKTNIVKWRNLTLNQDIPAPNSGYYSKILPLFGATSNYQGFTFKEYVAKNTTTEFNPGDILIKRINTITNTIEWFNGNNGIGLTTPPALVDYFDRIDGIFSISPELKNSGISNVVSILNNVGDFTSSFNPIPGRPYEIYFDSIGQDINTPTILEVYYDNYRNDLYNDLIDRIEIRNVKTRRELDPILTNSNISLKLISIAGATSITVTFRQ